MRNLRYEFKKQSCELTSDFLGMVLLPWSAKLLSIKQVGKLICCMFMSVAGKVDVGSFSLI